MTIKKLTVAKDLIKPDKSPLDIPTKKPKKKNNTKPSPAKKPNPLLKDKKVGKAVTKDSKKKPAKTIKERSNGFWDTLTLKEQEEYLAQHPKSKFKVNKKGPGGKKSGDSGEKSKKVKPDKEDEQIKEEIEHQPAQDAPESKSIHDVDVDDPDSEEIDSVREQTKTLLNAPEPKGDDKVAKKWASHIAKARSSPGALKKAAKLVLKALPSKQRKELRELHAELKENPDQKIGRSKSRLLGAVGASIKLVSLLGVAALSVAAYHYGGNSIALPGELINNYSNHFRGMGGNIFADSKSRDSFNSFVASLGSHGHHGGGHKHH
jgi:hypothetical protein